MFHQIFLRFKHFGYSSRWQNRYCISGEYFEDLYVEYGRENITLKSSGGPLNTILNGSQVLLNVL